MSPKVHPYEKAFRAFALGYPETHEDFPWGDRAIKVKKKVFVFMSHRQPRLSLSVKLANSHESALTLPFAEPTHYGLGKSGWVTCTFEPGAHPPVDLLERWIDESFRSIAPAKLVALLEGGATADKAPVGAANPARKSRRPPARRAKR